jgi:hypothetical protein
MRTSTRWSIWLTVVVVAAGMLCFRIFSPYFTKPDTPAAIPDFSVSNPLNLPGGGDVSAEAYEVYSALYQQPQPEPLAFAEDSQTDVPQLNGSCLKPSTSQEHEMADAFVAANQQSHRWGKKFAMPVGYLLLSRADVRKAQDCIVSGGKSTADCDAYQSLRHVRYLGLPGFDHTHSRALVSVMKMCGGNCGSGGIFAVRKSGGTWIRAEPDDFTRDCSWMY